MREDGLTDVQAAVVDVEIVMLPDSERSWIWKSSLWQHLFARCMSGNCGNGVHPLRRKREEGAGVEMKQWRYCLPVEKGFMAGEANFG